ncbi:putative tetratricopeptide-like helical domain-containing protein [Medicago truncatula]|nr:putative tetratricopeptide-like helical domain-containing protein [Medicago truncatula]
MSSDISLFHKIIDTGDNPTTQTLNHLLVGFCRRRQTDKAMLFYNDIILKNGFLLNHDSYLILINGLCEIGETQLAINMLRQALLIDKEPKDDCDVTDTLKCCYNSIFRLCKDRLVNQAYDLYSEMIHVNNIEPNYTTYQNLTYGYCILGQFKQAMELLRYRIVTEQEVKSAKCAAALMIKGSVKPNAASYHSVIGRLYEEGARSVVMNNIAQRVEKLLRAKHFFNLEINKYD